MKYYGFSVGEQHEGVTHARTYRQILDLVEIAERGGFEGWFFAEHHGAPDFSVVPSPNLLVAAASELTTRLRLGVLVTVLPYHHPLRAAEEVRMLDQLTGGRLEIGYGRGAIRHEQQAYGIERQRTPEIFETGLQILLDLLRDGRARFDSEWWSGSIDTLTPAPVQRPHPPLWLATVSDSSIVRAARLGTHAATTLLPLRAALSYRERFHEEWRKARPDQTPGTFSCGVTIAIGETRAEAERFARAGLEKQAERFLNQISDRPAEADAAYADHERGWREFVDSSFAQMIERGLILFGSADDAVEQLGPFVEAGVEALTVVSQFRDLDYGFARRSLELFATEVVPKADPNARLRVRAET